MDIDIQQRRNEVATYVIQQRNRLRDTFDDWHRRIEDVHALARGSYLLHRQSDQIEVNAPVVDNLLATMPRDVARMVTEVRPRVDSPPKGDTRAALQRAHEREAIADTYWAENQMEVEESRWSMDLNYAGAAFGVAWWGDDCEYPKLMRVAPENCYPNIVNGKLVDLMTIQLLPLAVADGLWPELELQRAFNASGKRMADEVEVIDYYSRTEMVKCVAGLNRTKKKIAGGLHVVAYEQHGLNRVPAAMVQLPTHDGALRGIMDQIHESVEAKDKMVRLSVEYTEQQVYAPFFSKGVINASQPPGPETIYQLDPNVPDAQMGRVPPAGSAPQLYALINLLDDEQRATLSYPRTRQGQTDISQGSGAFVDSTQGGLSSLVKESQRLIGLLRQDLTKVAFMVDEMYLDTEKYLVRPVDKKWMYTPTESIEHCHRVQVNYGAAAGIGPLNADVRLMQYLGAGVIPREVVANQLDFIENPADLPDMRERERSADAVAQRFLTDPNVSFDEVLQAYKLQRDKGMSLVDAALQAREAAQAQQKALAEQQAAAAAAASQAAPELQTPSADAAGEALSLAKGGIPTEPGLEAEDIAGGFTPPPFTYIQAR